MIKDDLVYLQHIRDAIDRILEYTREGKTSFLSDTKTQDAVVRNLQVMGEAAKRVSDLFKDSHPSLPWRQMTGTRDRVTHDYLGVSLKLVWDIVEHELPAVRLEIDSILRRQ